VVGLTDGFEPVAELRGLYAPNPRASRSATPSGATPADRLLAANGGR